MSLGFVWEKGPSQIQARPTYRPSFCGKLDRTAPQPVTEPGKKLFLIPFDQHRTTSNSQRRDHGLVPFKLGVKPVGPFRDAGNTVDVGQRSPDKQGVGISQQGSSCAARRAAGGKF